MTARPTPQVTTTMPMVRPSAKRNVRLAFFLGASFGV
jgi:hypothetical protein